MRSAVQNKDEHEEDKNAGVDDQVESTSTGWTVRRFVTTESTRVVRTMNMKKEQRTV
jgi:hypothetical protein